MATTPGDDGWMVEVNALDRPRRTAEGTPAQAVVAARRAERGRPVKMWSLVLECAAGVVGFAASVGAAFVGSWADDLG